MSNAVRAIAALEARIAAGESISWEVETPEVSAYVNVDIGECLVGVLFSEAEGLFTEDEGGDCTVNGADSETIVRSAEQSIRAHFEHEAGVAAGY